LLNILYQDQDLLAIHKPAGLLVHKSSVAADISENAVDLLQAQIGMPVFPIHRLDRATSGVLLFALSAQMTKVISLMMQENEVKKWYISILRGTTSPAGHITKSLSSEYNPTKKSAITYYKTLKNCLVNIPYRRFDTTPYSVVLASPQTGRTHQLRQHFAHIRHYIIGDKKHGDIKQNKHILAQSNEQIMYLHACQLSFNHPISQENIIIQAPIPSNWGFVGKLLDVDFNTVLIRSELSNHPLLFFTSSTIKQQCTHHVYA
jgi:tRNA pseudouridine65 synthase